jgi:RND family efflux transporter MFP subunit
MRKAFPLVAVLAAALLSACSRQAPAPEPVRSVRSTVIGTSATGFDVQYAAEIRARVESRLGPRVGGKLVRRAVEVGDVVRPGQLLAQLDPSDLLLGAQAAQSAVTAAQVNADQAKADLGRFQELHRQGFISAAELERRESAARAAAAQLDQAKAQAGAQGNQARHATLTADVAGVVTAVEAEAGQVVAAGTPIVRLAHDGPRDAVFQVPEDKVAPLRALLGRPGGLQVRPWGQTDARPATVREVGAAADPVTRTFVVKADVGRDAEWRLGQTVTVLLGAARADGVITLPLSAVWQQGGLSHVWVVDPKASTVTPQAIRVAGADGNRVVVAGGLQPGQRVVTAGVHVLTPGQLVRLEAAPTAASAPAEPASR